MDKNEDIYLFASHIMESWNTLIQCLIKNPEKLMNSQINYWQEYQKLYQNTLPNTDLISDKRFNHADWNNNILFNFIKKSYLLTSKHIENLITNTTDQENKNIVKKLQFYAHQYTDAISPMNFVQFNPEVLEKIEATNGESLINGFKQFLEDIEQGNGQLNIKTTDPNSFKLGENIACTPGKVIYQNDLIQLIQYRATTKKTYQIPLLIIPPWINKYYILDLQQENSLVKWLVDQGFTVFMISWVNPTNKQQNKIFSDYMFEGPVTALNIIKKMMHTKQINVLGYCIGGTLLACTLAYLAKINNSSIRSATFITTLLDFSEPGELGVFIDDKQIKRLEEHMKDKGYLDGRIMASVFNALRANDLIWAYFVNNYLKGQKPKSFDLLFWNSDPTNIPHKVHSFYLRNMYLKNLLIKKNKLTLGNVALNLKDINIPHYFLAAREDHIVPWKGCFKSSQALNEKSRFVLTASGHVAGVVNPPYKNKYGYWINDSQNKNAEEVILDKNFNQGSWWLDWVSWLNQYSGVLKTSKKIKNSEKIENAPGSYVKVNVSDIENSNVV